MIFDMTKTTITAVAVFGFFMLICLMNSNNAHANQGRLQKEIIGYAEAVANFCTPGKWTTPVCYKVLSNSNKVLVANFMADLHGKGFMTEKKTLEEGCAAVTALHEVAGLSRQSAASAMTECYNTLTEVADKAGMAPNPSHTQLFIAAVNCYRDDTVETFCPAIEKSLGRYKK